MLALGRRLPAHIPLFSRLGWREKAWFRLSPWSHEDAFPITLLFSLPSTVPFNSSSSSPGCSSPFPRDGPRQGQFESKGQLWGSRAGAPQPHIQA